MTLHKNLTGSLEPFAIDDGLRARAYESVPSEQRGGIKQAIARLYAFWGKGCFDGKSTLQFQDFVVRDRFEPAPYTLAVFCGATATGRGIIPALLPSIMAGVELTIPWFIDEEQRPLGDDVLFALEMLGIEGAYCSNLSDALTATRSLLGIADGRVVFTGYQPTWYEFILSAAEKDIRIQSYCSEGHVYPALAPDWFVNHHVIFE